MYKIGGRKDLYQARKDSKLFVRFDIVSYKLKSVRLGGRAYPARPAIVNRADFKQALEFFFFNVARPTKAVIVASYADGLIIRKVGDKTRYWYYDLILSDLRIYEGKPKESRVMLDFPVFAYLQKRAFEAFCD